MLLRQRAKEIAWWLRTFSVHSWVLEFGSQHLCNKPDPVCACNPSVVVGWRREVCWDLVTSILAKKVRFRFKEKPCLKGIWWRVEGALL